MSPSDEPVNILLVDDQSGNLVALEAMLGDFGLHLVKATSGEAALRHLLHDEFAVILLDVMMPGLDGFETAALIRERERTRNTPIIFLTAASKSEALVFKGYSVGAVDYIFKPVQPEILKSKVAVFVDLFRKTEQVKRQAEQLQRQNQVLEAQYRLIVERTAQLEAANKELEAFSYSVSHDLRAPLRAIDGFSRILIEEHASQLASAAQDYLHKVRDNAQRMGRLIDDLLTFSRLSRQPLNKQLVAPADLARQVLADLSQEQAERRVEVVIDDLPSCDADPALLKQVIANLLGNALKYTRKRGAALIEVGCREEDGERVYFVKDNGVGFEMRYVGKLFGVFQRLHRAEEYEGTGVGLAIVQRIVHRHGGRVWAEAAVDQGATFYFTLGGGVSHG